MRKLLLDSITQLNFLGFNSSLILYGLSTIASQTSSLQDAFTSVFDHFHTEHTHGVLRLSTTISMHCFEVFADSQMRDLFAPYDSTEVKVRESETTGVFVEGLVALHCFDAVSSMRHITEALKHQTVLVSLPIPNLSIVPNSAEEKLYAPKVIGPASHIFVTLHIKQFMYVGSTRTIVQLDSTLQIVLLASSDHLGIHASPTEAISFMTLSQFDELFSSAQTKVTSKVRDVKQAHFANQEVKKNLQQNSFRALSTLTRVVQLLGAKYDTNSSTSKSSAEAPVQSLAELVGKKSKAAASKRPKTSVVIERAHIPFRDSLLTRLLQSSLQGNFAQFVLTRINSEVNSFETSFSAMRFASGLHKLYNVISNTKKQICIADFEQHLSSSTKKLAYVCPLLTADIRHELGQSNAEAIAALNSLIVATFGDPKNFEIKNFSDFERAILNVREDLKEISDFCEEIDSYFDRKHDAESGAISRFKQASLLPVLGRTDSGLGPRFRAPSLGSAPPLQRVHSSLDSFGSRRLSSFEVQIQPSSMSADFDDSKGPKLIPPQHRTSLPNLSAYLLHNGVSDFHDSYFPDIKQPTATTKKRVEKPGKALRKTKLSTDPTSSSSDAAADLADAFASPPRRHTSISYAEEGAEQLLSEPEKAFFRGVSRGLIDGIEEALREGVSVHVRNSFGRDTLQVAARNGSLEVLRKLHEVGGNLFTVGPDGDTLFHIACGYGHMHVLLWLLEQGIDPLTLNDKGQNAAHIAARRGEMLVLKFLHFMCFVDFTARDNDGKTPIQSIPRYGPDNIAEMKSFINMITAPPETKDLHVFVLEREMSMLRRHLVKIGLLSASVLQEIERATGSRIMMAGTA